MNDSGERYEKHLLWSNTTLVSTEKLITVITPYFNNCNLFRTIESVLRQSYPNIEYIIADDGSINTDTNIKCIEGLLKQDLLKNFSSIQVIQQHQNVGTVRNLNAAIKESRGEYIFILSADDMFVNDSVLSKWKSFMEQNNALVSTAKRVICKDSIANIQCIRPTRRQIHNIDRLRPKELYTKMAYENLIIGCCTAYQKDCFLQYGYFDKNYILLEDHPKALELLKNDVRIFFWDELAIYYMDDGVSGVVSQNTVFEQDVERLLKEEAIYQGHDENAIVLKHRERKERLIQFYKAWNSKKLVKAFSIYPKQAIKEILKPFRSMLIKTYLLIWKNV